MEEDADLVGSEDEAAVRGSYLPYGRHEITDEDVKAVVDTLRSDWLTTGPRVRIFEEEFADWVGVDYAVSFSSGTAALHASVGAAGLGSGDEAITSPLTFCATPNSVLYAGALPVFADVRPDLLTLDPEAAAERVTSRTRAILPVDYAGHPADLDAFADLADRHGLVVIEDACHALGSEYRGRRVGAISTMTVFSFHPVKHITTAEGGMVTTNDRVLAERLRRFRNHGITVDASARHALGTWEYEMVELGYNYRLSDVACALGSSQLRRLDSNLQRRREIAARYSAALEALPEAVCPVEAADVQSAWHLYPIRLRLDRISADRRTIFNALRARNIGVNVHYIPVHLHPYYRDRFGFAHGSYPSAEAAYESLLSLPMFHLMSDDDVDDVIVALRACLSSVRNDRQER